MHLVQEISIGGLESLVTDMSLNMHGDRFDVEVCCMDDLGIHEETLKRHGIRVTLVQRNQTRYDKFYPIRLAKYLRQRKVDILHLHSGTFFPGAVAGWLARVPARIYTDHGRALFETKFRLTTERFAGYLVDRVVAVSKELEEYMITIVKVPSKRTITVINGINTARLAPGPKPPSLLESFGLTPDQKVIGSVGRLEEVKDQRTMIEAFRIVRKAIPNAILILVGDGPMRQSLEKQLAECRLESAVMLTGWQSNVAELLKLFDVFVLSSLSEGTSVSLLEAMACGIPPVVTNVGGNPSVVTHDHDGLITEPSKPQQLADAMLELLRDKEKHTRLAQQAIRRVEEAFSLQSMVNNYTSIYFDLLKQKRKYRWLADG